MGKIHNRKGRRLRLVPLTVGVYGAFLGLGLMVTGLFEAWEGTAPEAIGVIRFFCGLVMACFGLYGIWDGVRDLVMPEKTSKKPSPSQLILTDISGNKSSNVTTELLQKQLKYLAENGAENNLGFHLQILPPPSVQEQGRLKQISCIYHQEKITLVAFFEGEDGEYKTCWKKAELDTAEEWFRQFLSGSLNFSGWKVPEERDYQDEEGFCQEEGKAFCHQLLVIFGESWHDEHKFFSARDLELAVEGVQEGKYQKVGLEWGFYAFSIFPGFNNDIMVIWQTDIRENADSRFLAKEGTVTQVKFWLIHDLKEGFLGEISSWADITDQVKKEWRKHGKVF